MSTAFRNTLLVLSVVLFSSACGPVATLPVTVTPQVTLTPSQTPTLMPSPTITSTPTITPTSTPDLSWLTDDQRNAIPKDAAVTENDQGQIVVNGQPWYEPDGNGGWKMAAEKLIADADHKFWGMTKIDSVGNESQFIYPVVESVTPQEFPMTLLGQEWKVVGLPVLIPDQNDSKIIKHFFVSLGLFDQNGNQFKGSASYNLPLLYISDGDGGNKLASIQEFLGLLEEGQQFEMLLGVGIKESTVHGQGLVEAQGIDVRNNVLPDGTILPTWIIYLNSFKY
ncbi:MAG: hypothetical protein ACOYY3_09025 [Chloroflexota bacterium]